MGVQARWRMVMEYAVFDLSFGGMIGTYFLAMLGLFLTMASVVGFNCFSERVFLFSASWIALAAGASCFLASIFLW